MRQLARLVPIVAALALIAPAPALGAAATTLHVTGHGRVFVTPDMATVGIVVTRSAATRRVARAHVDRVVARMIAGLVDASAAALRDARTRADAAAAQLGMHVGGVQSVDLDPGSAVLQATGVGGSGTGPPVPAPKPRTPVLPGHQEVDASVDVVYLLG